MYCDKTAITLKLFRILGKHAINTSIFINLVSRLHTVNDIQDIFEDKLFVSRENQIK